MPKNNYFSFYVGVWEFFCLFFCFVFYLMEAGMKVLTKSVISMNITGANSKHVLFTGPRRRAKVRTEWQVRGSNRCSFAASGSVRRELAARCYEGKPLSILLLISLQSAAGLEDSCASDYKPVKIIFKFQRAEFGELNVQAWYIF